MHYNFTHFKMTEKFLTRNILFVFILAHVNTSSLSLVSSTRVTVGIMDRYHTTCVFLLFPQLQQGEYHDIIANCHLYWFYMHGQSHFC